MMKNGRWGLLSSRKWRDLFNLSGGSCDDCEVALGPQFSHFQHQLLLESQPGERGLTFCLWRMKAFTVAMSTKLTKSLIPLPGLVEEHQIGRHTPC